MKTKRIAAGCLIGLVLAAFIAGCATSPSAPDMALAANVKAALESDKSIGPFDIGIETRDGVVILTGWVSSQEAVAKAGRLAAGAQGVRSVENNLTSK